MITQTCASTNICTYKRTHTPHIKHTSQILQASKEVQEILLFPEQQQPQLHTRPNSQSHRQIMGGESVADKRPGVGGPWCVCLHVCGCGCAYVLGVDATGVLGVSVLCTGVYVCVYACACFSPEEAGYGRLCGLVFICVCMCLRASSKSVCDVE